MLVRRLEKKHADDVSSDKVLSLSAYTSGVLLLIFALFIIIEAAERFFQSRCGNPLHGSHDSGRCRYGVNVICAFVLHDKHRHDDYNRHSAYLHVLADALTSLGAIFGLVCAMIWDIIWIDTFVALICSIVIIRWAKNLLADTGKALTSRTESRP